MYIPNPERWQWYTEKITYSCFILYIKYVNTPVTQNSWWKHKEKNKLLEITGDFSSDPAEQIQILNTAT